MEFLFTTEGVPDSKTRSEHGLYQLLLGLRVIKANLNPFLLLIYLTIYLT